jgi:uncharacterized membrane protein
MTQENIDPQNTSEKVKLEFDVSQLEPNMAAVFAYLIPLVGGIVFFTAEKKNKFVRFHAFQSILFWVFVWVVLWLINTIFAVIPFFYYIGGLFNAMMSFAIFGGWLYLMWNAYNKKEYLLPYIGKIAKEQAYGKQGSVKD